jgi:hypothetical protein
MLAAGISLYLRGGPAGPQGRATAADDGTPGRFAGLAEYSDHVARELERAAHEREVEEAGTRDRYLDSARGGMEKLGKPVEDLFEPSRIYAGEPAARPRTLLRGRGVENRGRRSN